MRAFLVCTALLIGYAHAEVSMWNAYRNVLRRIAKTHRYLNQPIPQAGTHGADLPAVPHCPGNFRSASKPTSVHRLLPGDIDIVAAMGDSLTAANGAGAVSIAGVLAEYRGVSFSIGGDEDAGSVVTLANILKNFNPDLYGYSTGVGTVSSKYSRFNVAYPGNIAQHMPGQASKLIERIRKNQNVNFNEDWKMVTLFIGGNNLCAFCKDEDKHSAETYVANIRQALDILAKGLPRTYVNLVEIFDISPVAQLVSGLVCNIAHRVVCKCGYGPKADVARLKSLSLEYQRALQDLVSSRRYEGREDFTVVLQPFFRNTTPPTLPNSDKPDFSYFAPDCFHFSKKGHNAAGKALWNNVLQPLGKKSTDWAIEEPIHCPVEGRYLPTRRN